MDITEQSLRDTGWEKWSRASARVCEVWYEKQIHPVVCLEIYLPDMNVVLNLDGERQVDLPNVRTMEALSLLEHLLSDNPAYTIVDTAPIDAAIAAQFPQGQATCERQ